MLVGLVNMKNAMLALFAIAQGMGIEAQMEPQDRAKKIQRGVPRARCGLVAVGDLRFALIVLFLRRPRKTLTRSLHCTNHLMGVSLEARPAQRWSNEIAI